ncbi:unnamed protein product [Dibothriocephalus latus]|uniref:Uncharacterized protein n=1 Tax=Dibothriocephalus latus TaxID=60516 RepID=A0A3P6QL45_DIBLA|nr:unnamed protein product [Dibothriocephalus latus]
MLLFCSPPAGPFSEIPAEVANIRKTASFQLILATARDVLTSFWHFCLGRGPVFDSAAARGPLMSAVCVIMRISYYMLLASFLYLIPTIAIALFFIGIIVSCVR